MLLRLMALVTALVHMVSAQNREGSVLRGENENSQSVIVTARSRAFLSCESGDMVVKVNFTLPFKGLMYAHRSRSSPCRIHGTGGYYYELRIPLKGCGTWQESPRVFVNNITIRFHPALELEEDETKTVVCRYPPPLTPPPGGIQVLPPPIISPTVSPTRVGTARLSEIEILIIICVLLFLSLLILGIGIAYFCLKRRNIHLIRKSTTTTSSAPPSQITRLSGSNLYPPSSLLSSVLGHTVRIPRAVPYSVPAGRVSAVSSPEHHYEDYPASTSTTETTSGEVSETSVSSSSLAEDQVDASKHLLYRKGFPKSILSIPKAILRRNGAKRIQTEPTIHQFHSKSSTSAAKTFVKRPEMEDQTVTTVLEPENHFNDDTYWTIDHHRLSRISEATTETPTFQEQETQTQDTLIKTPVPVYAQVHKPKKSTAKEQLKPVKSVDESKDPIQPTGVSRRQRQVLTLTPEETKTSEEVTKNTTVTTSFKREVAETRILSPLFGTESKVPSDMTLDSLETAELQMDGNKSQTSTLVSNVPKSDLQKEPKTFLIRDVADIYLTTTVETESREQTTTVSRDIVQQLTKPVNIEQPPNKSITSKDKPAYVPNVTNNWNVVIRQKELPKPTAEVGSSLDTASESNAGSSVEPPSDNKPKFDVKIRTIPPVQLKPKISDEMINIPPLEMPIAVGKLKEALMPKVTEIKDTFSLPVGGNENSKPWSDKEKKNIRQRSVKWQDKLKKPIASTVSSSDSFQSAESLRERSSSEVLEVAPTLPSQQESAIRPAIERSSSEITTSPKDQVRWVGGVVPVLESLSPEFLANIPVVIQGGFFNQQKTTPTDKDEVI